VENNSTILILVLINIILLIINCYYQKHCEQKEIDAILHLLGKKPDDLDCIESIKKHDLFMKDIAMLDDSARFQIIAEEIESARP
jgi:hypothetical protein